MFEISQTRPIVLNSDSEAKTRILREYADFWKIPYLLDTSVKGATIFGTSHALGSDKSKNSPLIITPHGEKESEKIARDYALSVSAKNALISLPAAPGTEVSIRTNVHEFTGPGVEPILMSGDTQVLTKV